MQIGSFSLSLAVKDIAASKAFYEKIGFTAMGGNQDQGWLIMKNPSVVIGLFQGMFEKNMMTFNPGWDENAQELAEFLDIRELQKAYKAAGIVFDSEADESSSGPAHFVISDPDGNSIMMDQHR